MNVIFVVVVGESASALGETEGFVWKVSASCHQHVHDLKSLRMFERTDSTCCCDGGVMYVI